MGHHHPFQFLADISLNNGRGPFAAFASRCHRRLPGSRTGSLFQLHRRLSAASEGRKTNLSLPDLGGTDQSALITSVCIIINLAVATMSPCSTHPTLAPAE